MHEDTAATMLLGLDGVTVVDIDIEDDSSATVYVQTAVEAACPDCATVASLAKQRRSCRLRDVPYGMRRMRVVWFKSTVAGTAEAYGVSWHTAHDAFVEVVDPGLTAEPGPVEHLGIDEVRRGRPRWEHDPDTGETRQLADRWHTGFTDLSGGQGLLGQVEGRASTDVISWLDERSPAWRAGVATVSIDMCAPFRLAARRMLPNATAGRPTRRPAHEAVGHPGQRPATDRPAPDVDRQATAARPARPARHPRPQQPRAQRGPPAVDHAAVIAGLLAPLDVAGMLLTLNALHTNKKTARLITGPLSPLHADLEKAPG